MKKSLSVSRFLQARTTPPHSPKTAEISNLSASLPLKKNFPTPEEMEAANVRALHSRGRLAYSPRAIARRRDELGLAPTSKRVSAKIPVIELERLRIESADWLRAGRLAGYSTRTLADRERTLEKLFWFFEREKFALIGREQIETFLLHIREGHLEPEGRFASGAHNPKAFQAPRPNTYRYHFDVLAAFWAWQTKKGLWPRTPFEEIEPARVPEDTDVMPLSMSEIEAMLLTAKGWLLASA